MLKHVTCAGALLLASLATNAAHGSVIYDVPAGITAQPSDDIRWNSTGAYSYGGGVAIAPHYFLSAQHLDVFGSFTLSSTVANVITTSTYTVAQTTDIPNTDLRIIRVNETIPASSIAPIYTGAAGSELGQTSSFVGFGYHAQGPVVNATGLQQNGWLWAGAQGKNFGANTISAITPDGPSNAPTLDYTFDPISGINEGVYTTGDSGGGMFIFHNGRYELAGIAYGVDQYYSAPNAGSAINAAIYNSTGLYVTDGNGNFYNAATVNGGEFLRQHGYASEIAPYIGQIYATAGVPEPTAVGLALTALAPLLLRRRNRRAD